LSVTSLIARHFDEALAELTKSYADAQFSRGVGVDSVVYSKDTNFFDPRLITQQNDDTWTSEAPDCCVTNLPEDGFVSVGWIAGVALLRLHRSNYASDDAFYGDSKAFMDIALKGLALTREVGVDDIRITSLGSARSEVTYVDHWGRIWQHRVWAMPYRDAYVIGFLLPTAEGYTAMIQVVSSGKVREAEAVLRQMTDQFLVSYAGSPAQWQAFLRRSTLLPKALSGVVLAHQPDWDLRTPRFQTRILNKVFPVSDQGQIGLIMGYIHQVPQFALDVVGATWSKDAGGKSTVGLSRIPRPPKTAKLELRAAYAEIASRRPPFDGQLLHDSADGFLMGQILNVPGNQKGKASSDLLYGVTVRLSGRNAYEDINELLGLVVNSTHILEHGVGEDIEMYQQPTVAAQSSPAAFSASDFAVIANGRDDATYGHDMRGRLMSEDFRTYVLSSNKDANTPQSTKRAAALFDYWRIVPGVMHNRDLWSSFLERNHLLSTMGHRLAVVEAEAKLGRALENGDPGPDWAEHAQRLIDAYLSERVDIAKSRAGELPARYSARNAPCPNAAAKLSNTDVPAIAPFTRSPEEFYPNSSRRAQIEGSVVVAVQVDTGGCGRRRGIVTSSGSDDIDQAALEFIDTAEFLPAQRQGTPVEAIYKTIVHFKID
jgi:TonB family protein